MLKAATNKDLRVFDIIPVAKFAAKIRSGTLKTENGQEKRISVLITHKISRITMTQTSCQ